MALMGGIYGWHYRMALMTALMDGINGRHTWMALMDGINGCHQLTASMDGINAHH
jgi:hypothetical protein